MLLPVIAETVYLNKLQNQKDKFAGDNGMWTLKVSRCKSYSAEKDADGQLVALNKTGQEHADIVVHGRPYFCKPCPEFHKSIISIEYGKDIGRDGNWLFCYIIILIAKSWDLLHNIIIADCTSNMYHAEAPRNGTGSTNAGLINNF